MRAGGGKQKGSSFERKVCVQLSLWVSKGKHKDLFWRSAMSGGRATVFHKSGTTIRQAGDICAVAPQGHRFTSIYFIECKHVKSLDIASFILDGKGTLAKFWAKASKQARDHMRRPLLIAKENRRPTLVLCIHNSILGDIRPKSYVSGGVDIFYLDDVLKIGVEHAL